MGQPLLHADNLGSNLLYPDVIVTDQSGTAGPAGFEAWRPFRSRRSPFVYWQPGTTNAEAYLQIACGQVRAVNCLVLDRGHNLSGFPVKWQASQDGFVTSYTAFTATVPTAQGSRPSDANGALTEEGAWIITFPTIMAKAFRFDIPAMGVGLQPNIVGLYPGLCYQPDFLYRPFPEHMTQLAGQEVVTPSGWRGRGPLGLNRASSLELRMGDPFEYELARYHIDELYATRPMWVVQDTDRASEAFCAIRPLGTSGFIIPTSWAWPIASVPFIEHEPQGV